MVKISGKRNDLHIDPFLLKGISFMSFAVSEFGVKIYERLKQNTKNQKPIAYKWINVSLFGTQKSIKRNKEVIKISGKSLT